jgi:predicted acetyltransferase
MVVRASQDDLREIYELHKIVYNDADNSYVDYFYRHIYNNLNMYLIKKENKLVSMGCRIPHTLMINEQLLTGSIISNLMTAMEYRKQGCMDEIVKTMIDNVEHTELITYVHASKFFEKYGFETMFYRREYELDKSNFKYKTDTRVSKVISFSDLSDIYAKFARRFTGYNVRDEKYYKAFNKEVESQNGQIVTVYNKDSEIDGYAVLYEKDNMIIIDEAIYLNLDVLFKVISLALELRDKVILRTTNSERLDLVFTGIKFKDYPYMMARINNYKLFNHLFDTNVKTVEEALSISKKPLFINEKV